MKRLFKKTDHFYLFIIEKHLFLTVSFTAMTSEQAFNSLKTDLNTATLQEIKFTFLNKDSKK